ncbi:metal ABC transporter permease [Lyngbya confervoides]|uniref:Metal ABC transporter permease n=1 Tax=Lyngbya confervoides BDU141951 TaxID=1574623 RepID=A0ABD4T441_9CYAN|nr:metal ABC transporter permease [Lyngbya confervoides]MCM1983218.1 metal ABC transporter permease [Lyngbya confervoides BDU141951]
MTLGADLHRMMDLLQLPFMQRALLGGILTGLTGGLMGSLTIVRQLSFFSDALGHSALLGISLGLVLGWNPSGVLLPFAVIFALGVTILLEKTALWTDALLNIIYSASLAIAVVVLSLTGTYKGGLHSLLFGDILAVQPTDLWMSGALLVVCALYLGLTLKTQMLITVQEPLAIARGVPVRFHRQVFISLLALVVGVSIQAVGVLLISAFIVIPACAARLICRRFSHHIVLSSLLGAGSAMVGLGLSAALNLPSGPSIVLVQILMFTLALVNPLRL